MSDGKTINTVLVIIGELFLVNITHQEMCWFLSRDPFAAHLMRNRLLVRWRTLLFCANIDAVFQVVIRQEDLVSYKTNVSSQDPTPSSF
jgi:hypothetical protein